MRVGGPKTLILFFTAALLAAVAFLMVADIEWRRRQAIASAETRAINRAAITAEYVRGRFALVDTSLRQLVIFGRRIGITGAPAEEWDDILEAVKASLPGEGSISVTDAKGVIRYSTLKSIIGQPRSDNDLFKYLSTHDVDEMVVDAPFPSPVQGGRYLIPVGRRLNTPGGDFEGVVVAIVLPEDFRDFFRTVSQGNLGVAWAFHPTGTVLVREPSDRSRSGEPAQDNPLLQAAKRHGTGIVHGALDPDGSSYVSAYRMLKSPPLTVAVSLRESDVLAEWRRQRRTSALAFGGLALTIVLFMAMLFRQMTALGAAVERERRAREQAEAAGRLKDEFLMTLSHELRTPLNAILGWARMLTSGAVPSGSQAQALAAVERNAQAQTRLVEDLLDVSRAITGKLKIESRPVDVAEPVLAAADTLRPAIIAKRLRFESEVDQSIPPILADPDRVQQIVWNLLSNAIKFTPSGGVITLGVRQEGSNVEITVRDTGIGITPDFLPFVFDRFRQADAGPRREHGGLGLGLAIVRHLVELHGGTVRAESEGTGKGATFRVLLPRT